ncbi:hypothetical protein FRC06_011093, partial [Ceratobasidium sp. 370]
MPGLEEEHPAEFLTLMHDSNSRQVLKSSEDVDLFRAVVKLKGLLDAGAISRETFLLNRRAILGHNETTSRAISNLTRNKELADAIMDALSRAHIAKAFQAGGWKKLTTGRVYGVAAGLVREMTAQVDLLTEGMSEVPEGVVTLMPRLCQVSVLEAQSGGKKKKKQPHPWDALPGKLAAALERVKARPASFVTPLNPKTADPWTLPDVVLLPSCMGANVVESELKALHRVMLHLLKVCAKEEHFERYASSNPDPLESEVDHPAGMLAHVLQQSRGDSPRIVGYEQKASIIHRAWLCRAELCEDLEEHKVPDTQSSVAADYGRLVQNSKCWWELLRLFKLRRFPFSFRLDVPREFGVSGDEARTAESSPQVNPSGTAEAQRPRLKRQKELGGSHGVGRSKRARLIGAPETLEDGERESEDEDEVDGAHGSEAGGGDVDMEEEGSEGVPEVLVRGGRQAGDVAQAGEGHAGRDDEQGGSEMDEDDYTPWLGVGGRDESGEDGEDDGTAPLPTRTGGDRQLGKTLDAVKDAATRMT